MNERIRELVKQAGGISYDDDNKELTPMLLGEGLEKFAELLIENVCYHIMDVSGAKPEHIALVAKHYRVEL